MLTLSEVAVRPVRGVAGGAASGRGGICHAASLLAPLAKARGLLLAVSGGPDSMALLRLAADWTRAQATAPIHVATVDHQLRPAARAEAEAVARAAAAHGLPHHLLVWDGPKPKSRIQEAAREARYRLLFARARALGLDHVVTAHHADDQAETILFRLLRGSGIGGLAGMAPRVRHGDIVLARPLLGLAKADLVAHCAALGQSFVDDPSNLDPVYARTRMRGLGALLAREGLDRHALLRLARRAARLEAALAPQVAVALSALTVETTGTGTRALQATSLAMLPEEIGLRVLKALIEAVAHPGRMLRLDRLETLEAALRHAIRRGLPHAATLGGVLVRLDGEGRLSLRREAPRRRGRDTPFEPDAL